MMTSRHGPEVTTCPLAVKRALRFNFGTHRRLPKLQGGMWAVGGRVNGLLAGVAIVGHPQARMADDGECLEVLRVAVIDGFKNVCSALYGACARAARAMGAADMWTFVHGDESGHTLRVSGWVRIKETDGGQWSRDGRQRELAIDPNPKVKWAVPWGRLARGA